MIKPRRIQVGPDPIDLAAGSRTSGVSIQWLRNSFGFALYLAECPPDELPEGEEPLALGSNPTAPDELTSIALGATDHLYVWRSASAGAGPIDVILGWA